MNATNSVSDWSTAAPPPQDPRRAVAYKRYQRPERPADDPPPDFLLLCATLGSMVGVVMKQRAVSWLCLLLAVSGAARARYGASGPAAVDSKQIAVALMAPIGSIATSYLSPSPEAIARARAAREAAKVEQKAVEEAAKAAVEGDSGGGDGWPEASADP